MRDILYQSQGLEMAYATLISTTLVTVLHIKIHTRAQEDNKDFNLSFYVQRSRRRNDRRGLISERNLRGVRELLFIFVMPAIAVTPRQHVIRITMTIMPASSCTNVFVCVSIFRESREVILSSDIDSLTFRNPKYY